MRMPLQLLSGTLPPPTQVMRPPTKLMRISFDELVVTLRGALSAKRKELVHMAFDILDSDRRFNSRSNFTPEVSQLNQDFAVDA